MSFQSRRQNTPAFATYDTNTVPPRGTQPQPKATVYQSYNQPTTSDPLNNSRYASGVTVPRSHSGLESHYRDGKSSGQNRKSDHRYEPRPSLVASLSKQDSPPSVNSAGRREPAVRFDDSHRHQPPSKGVGHADEDTSSDISGFFSARHDSHRSAQPRGYSRNHPADDETGSETRSLRYPPDNKRTSRGSFGDHADSDTEEHNYAIKSSDRRPSSYGNRVDRHGAPCDPGRRGHSTEQGRSERKPSTTDPKRPPIVNRTDNRQSEQNSKPDEGAHHRHRHDEGSTRSNPKNHPGALDREPASKERARSPPNRQNRDRSPPTGDHRNSKSSLHRQGTSKSQGSQLDARGPKGQASNTGQRHGKDSGDKHTQPKPLLGRTRRESHGDHDVTGESKSIRGYSAARPSTPPHRRHEDSDEDSESGYPAKGGVQDSRHRRDSHADPPQGRRYSRHGDADVDQVRRGIESSSLHGTKPVTHRGMMLRQSRRDDPNDDDDIGGVLGAQRSQPRDKCFGPPKGERPRPRPGGDDDDIGGVFGAKRPQPRDRRHGPPKGERPRPKPGDSDDTSGVFGASTLEPRRK